MSRRKVIKLRRCQSCLFSSVLLLTHSLQADPLDGMQIAMDESYFFSNGLPVVLSASRLAQPITNSPASMTIIDRELIEASGALSIPDVLRLVPGFQVSFLSGQNLTAQYHGLADQNPKRMQVMIDGRSVYHAVFGGVRWDTLAITLNDVERIEVLRGSNAAAYGSNAFMGVVNIITRHASQDQGNQISLTTGYADTHQLEWRHGGKLGDLDYRFGLSTFSTSGFPNYNTTHDYWDSTGIVPADTIPTLSPFVGETTIRSIGRDDDQQIGRFNFRGDYQFDNGSTLLFEAGYAKNDRDDSRLEGDFDKLRPDENLRSSFQLVKWSGQTLDQGEISLQFAHNLLTFDNRHTAPFIFDVGPTLFNLGATQGGYKYKVHSYDIEFQHNLASSDGWRSVWGLGARFDEADGENAFVDDRTVKRRQLRAFANTEKQFGENDQWVLNAGLMLEHQKDFGFFASPRLAINHHLDEHHTVRLAAARAYRMPSMVEQHIENAWFAITPPFTGPYRYVLYSNRGKDISPEQVTTYELGFMSSSWIDGLNWDVRLFREELRDYIDIITHENGCAGCDTAPAAPLPLTPHNIGVMENSGSLNINGIDLQIRYAPNDRTTFVQAASITDATGRSYKIRDSSGQLDESRIRQMGDFVPNVTFSALATHRFDHGWSGSVGYYAMSDMDWPNDGDALRSYDRVDLRVAKKWRWSGSDAQIELIVQNLLDDEYKEFRHQNIFERRAYLRFRIDLD